MRLEGKTALITGAGTGIGEATAILFAEEGADVVATDLDLDGAEQTAAAVRSRGRRALGLAADIADPSQVPDMVDKAIGAFGGIDILVNNAGVGKVPVPTLELDDMEAWDRVMAINVRGVFQCSQHVARWMKDHGGGKIVNVGSQTGIAGAPNINAYGPSKAAVINMTRSLAVEWAKYKINVNCVAPCWTRTARLEAAIAKGIVSLRRDPEEKSDGPAGRAGRGREGHPLLGLRRRRVHHRGDAAGGWGMAGVRLSDGVGRAEKGRRGRPRGRPRRPAGVVRELPGATA